MFSPVHVTVTAPAATEAPTPRVMMISGVVPVTAETAVTAGDDTSQAVPPASAFKRLVVRVCGSVRVILPPAGIADTVVNLTERGLEVPGAEPKVTALAAVAVTQPTQGVLVYAARADVTDVSIFKPVVPVAVAVTAANASSVSPEHVTVTDPAARAEVTVNVIALVAYAEVETTEVGEVMPHKLIAVCAVTRLAGKVSVILLLEACVVKGVDVLKVTVAVFSAPTAIPIVSASKAAVTPPIIGVLIKDGIVSVEVSIFKPVVPVAVAVTAAIASNVSPVHVTVTSPANIVEKGARVKVILLNSNFDVVVAPDVIPHELSGFAEMKPEGNVRVILLPEDANRVVDVEKVTLTDFADPDSTPL
jgi:hypothetical protein